MPASLPHAAVGCRPATPQGASARAHPFCPPVQPSLARRLKAGCHGCEPNPAAASELEHRESLEGRPHQPHSLASQAQVLSQFVQQ